MFPLAFFTNVYALSACACLLLWRLGTSTFGFWRTLKFDSMEPVTPFLGNIAAFALLRKSYHEMMHDVYTYFGDRPFGGFFQMREPMLLLRDPDLVHRILVTDFRTFCDRGMDLFFPHKRLNPLSVNMFLATGDDWRALRKRMTPVFTPSKLKPMQHEVSACIDNLNVIIEQDMVDDSTDQDLKVLYDRLTIDVIGSCAFGIECNSMKTSGEFRSKGVKALAPSLAASVKLLVSIFSKSLLVKLKLADFSKDVTQFFRAVVLDTILYRRRNGVVKHDLLQMLMDLQNSYDDPKYAPAVVERNVSEEDKFDEINILGNVFMFFIAGYETSASTLSFCLYELALHQDLQDRLRAEVVAAYNEHGQLLTADVLKELKYMDAVLSETLRKYPPLAWLIRHCGEDYQIPGTDKIIKRGVKIIIPTWSIQHDARHYPDPERFDPERFYGDRANEIRKGTYVPFGDGPRNCIGMQFAKLEMRAALADALLKYNFASCSKTEVPLTYKSGAITMTPKHGVWINMTKRKLNANL